MASRELSILVKAVGAMQAAKQIKGVDSAVGKLGKTARRGIGTAATNLTRLGLAAGAGIAVAVKGGIESLAQLESAVSQVDGALAQIGGDLEKGGLSGQRIAGWANEIEAAIGAAFDDKDITAATANLIRFGKVAPTNLRPAMVVMTDLAAKTGSVESASALLGKALADPAKAAGKLARVGVVLTEQQQDQIKAMVKAGDAAGAQKVLLEALSETTKGAAAATQGPYQRSLSTLRDVTEDAQRALAEGFLPVLEKIRDFLSKELAKPETLQQIRDFGKGLASGLDSLIEIAKNLPWQTIGDSLKAAGAGAKTVLDAFVGLPPWVQTAVLTGWGLNKLTGGALGDLVGQGIKIGFGQVFARGSSPANPLWVQSVGGGVGVGGAAGGLGMLGAVGVAGLVLTTALVVGKALKDTFNLNPYSMGATARGEQRTQGNFTANTGSLASSAPLRVLTDHQDALRRDTMTRLASVRDKLEANRIAVQSGSNAIVAAIRNQRMQFSLALNISGARTSVQRVSSGSTLSRHPGGFAGAIRPTA